MIKDGRLDWATAEAIAVGSLLSEGMLGVHVADRCVYMMMIMSWTRRY